MRRWRAGFTGRLGSPCIGWGKTPILAFEQRVYLMPNPHRLMEKIQALPAERIAEVEDFVEFIAARERERTLTRAAAAASAPSFAAIWSNPEDDSYDEL